MRMLYEKRTAPDNWVPPDFLKRLQKNGSICLFVTSYIFLLWKWVTPFQMEIVLLLATFAGFVLWIFVILKPGERSFSSIFTPIRTGVIILLFSSSLAPLLHSLLDTISTDTIHAMSFIFLLLNFASLPYANGMRACKVDGTTDSNIVSVANGFLASLCMASRLPGPEETFLLILFATLDFATWPTVRHQIQVRGGLTVRVCFTIGLGVAALLSLLPFFFNDEIEYVYRSLLAFSVISSTSLINFGFPFLFFKMQSIKANINGPWDEAIIQR